MPELTAKNAFFLGLLSACAGCAPSEPATSAADLHALGPGFYSVKAPSKEFGPVDADGHAVAPKVTDSFAQLPQTNDWWSSLIWAYKTGKEKNPYSEPMFPHPLAAQAEARGLRIGYTSEPQVSSGGYFYPLEPALLVGVEGLNAKDTRVASYGDWTVTAEWRDSAHNADITLGHGLPFAYVTHVRGKAQVKMLKMGSIWAQKGETIALSAGGHDYALFAPPGTSWQLAGDTLTADLAGSDYFSVAVLPEKSDAALELFHKHAYAFVTGSKVTWQYDRSAAKVVSHFELAIEHETKEDAETPLTALYRHQWLRSKAPLTRYSYASPRGKMKLLEGGAFDTEAPVFGLLPSLPDAAHIDQSRLRSFLKLVSGGDLFKPGLEGTRDSYWEGKSFGKIAGLVRLADQAGATDIRDELVRGLEHELEDWFDGEAPRYYYRNETWKTIIGTPTMYQSGALMNDHHFHYAYYVLAAATVAQYDHAWAKRYAPCINELIRDANSWRHDDPRYPFLRYFDAYAGHSWASGTTFFERGNNEESSSEDMNFAAATALWGEVTDQPEIRDAGLFLYTTVTEAIAQYWYDVDHAVFPKGFSRPAVGIVWGSGGAYDTWFSPLPAFIHGIQLTPMLTGSLWLGQHPDAIERVYAHVQQASGGSVLLWRDMYWLELGLSNPAKPLAWFEDEHYFEPEFGNSMAYTYHWLTELSALGHVDVKVTANTPLYAVFTNGTQRTYVAYNAQTTPRRVSFSDGTELSVGPGKLEFLQHHAH